MSIKRRALLGALLLFGGLLLITGAGLTKSNNRINYERDLEKNKPDPRVPQNGTANVFIGLGIVMGLVGPVFIVSALRDMTRQLGDIESRTESQMRMEMAVKRDPKPGAKP